MDYARYLDKVEKVPLSLKEGFKYELINKEVKGAIAAENFLLRVGELNPGVVHPGVSEIHDKAEHAFYVLDGQGIIVIDGKSFQLRPNAAIYVPAGSAHQLKNTGDMPLRYVVIYAPYETKTFIETPDGVLLYHDYLKKKKAERK